MANLKEEILEEVTKMIESVKRKLSESKMGGNSLIHIRQPPNMQFDTPEWGRTISEYLTERMDDTEASLGRIIGFTTEATTKALTEVGELKVLFKRQSNQITDIFYQLNHARTENK